MDRYKVDTVVIGAGVVGLAVARSLAKLGREVWVLEKEPSFGQGTSSRNSEVIHAGIYYPKDSLKARLCVQGKHSLYRYLDDRDLPYKRCGKLIVATNDAQVDEINNIIQRAKGNGVEDLELLSSSTLQKLEPALSAKAAIMSPSTGIVDSHALMSSILGDAERDGAQLVTNCQVEICEASDNKYLLNLVGHDCLLEAGNIVNAAGLFAPHLAEDIFHAYAQCGYDFQGEYAKGSYFTYDGRTPFNRLIYPVPEDGGLGVHLTLDLGGSSRFGPDVEWKGGLGETELIDFDYAVDPSRRSFFASSIRSYWPEIDESRLQAGYAGLRPKLKINGSLCNDFLINSERDHGLKGFVNLLGIESPGLTSSMAIADLVSEYFA